jgi:hypothetical protein
METGIVSLGLDGRWDLTELSELSSVYTQLYSLVFSLQPDEEVGFLDDQLDYIYTKFPWRGGYSAVDFYQNLYHRVPAKYRPKVVAIQYGSPGHIDLSEVLVVAGTIAALVRLVASSADRIHNTYRNIQKGSQDHKLSKINVKKEELKLSARQIRFVRESVDELATAMNLRDAERATLEGRTQGNELAQLKILSSYYRRVKKLVDLHLKGKLFLDEVERDKSRRRH